MRATLPRRLSTAAMVIGLSAGLLAGCSSSPPQPSANLGTAVDHPLSKAVLDAKLVDQAGRSFTMRSLEGKTVFIAPFLTLCADVCPFTTGNFQQVQASVDAAGQSKDVVLIEFSIDPERDSVARLAGYAKANDVSWTLARSDAAGTKALVKYFGYFAKPTPVENAETIDPETGLPIVYDVIHSDGYAVIDTQGVLKFFTAATPHFHGLLPAKLRAFLSTEGKETLEKPDPRGWRPAGALEAISWVAGAEIPLAPLK